MSQELIKKSLIAALIESDLELDYAWPNRDFTPANKRPWCKVYFGADEAPIAATFGTQGEDQANGYMQLDLNYPTGRGEQEINEMVRRLQSIFGSGKTFQFSGQTTHIDAVGYTDAGVQGGFFRKIVRVTWWGRIKRISA